MADMMDYSKGRTQRVFENRALRRIFGPKREGVTGGWRRLHNEELHNVHATSNIRTIKSRSMSWAGHVASMGTTTNVYSILVGKIEGKSPLERSRCRWKGNIRMVRLR
jgi:hypothetical protein